VFQDGSNSRISYFSINKKNKAKHAVSIKKTAARLLIYLKVGKNALSDCTSLKFKKVNFFFYSCQAISLSFSLPLERALNYFFFFLLKKFKRKKKEVKVRA